MTISASVSLVETSRRAWNPMLESMNARVVGNARYMGLKSS
jgi:hypothetical protein